MKDPKKFNNLEDLRERVVDLPESERQKQETANEIQKALLGLVNEKNEKADAYEKNFKRWVEGKIAKRESRQGTKEMKTKYWTTKPDMKTAEKYKEQYNEQDYKKILAEIKEQHKNKEDMHDDIFAIIKRAFNKNVTVHKESDIDKDASLFLLKKIGFFKDNKGERLELQKIIQEVPQGESGNKWLSIDTGWTTTWIKVDNVVKRTNEGKIKNKSFFGSKVILSEHSDLSPESKKTERPTSSTHMIYYMLNQLGQLIKKDKEQLKKEQLNEEQLNNKQLNNKQLEKVKKEKVKLEKERLEKAKLEKEQLERFINFVDIVDSLDYQANGIDYENSYKTLFGLYDNIGIKDIYDYFKDPRHTGFEILSDDYLEKNHSKKYWEKETSLKEISIEHEERIKKNIKQVEEAQDKWQFGKFDNQMFIIALDNEIPDWARVTSHYDYWLLKIFPSGDFYMFSPRLLPKKILDFDTDGHFLTIRNISKENLEKLLEIFDFNPRFTQGIKEKIMEYRETAMKLQKEKIEKVKEKEDQKKDQKDKIKNNIDALKDLTIKELKKINEEGPIIGIINNISNKNIHVNLTPTITGMIKNETRETTLMVGEKIKVNIKNISVGIDKTETDKKGRHKRLVSLEKAVS